MSNPVLTNVLSLAIPSSATRDMNLSDLEKLMTSYGIIEMARDDFIAGKLTLDEYLDLCATHDMNVDSYLDTVEFNLKQLNLV